MTKHLMVVLTDAVEGREDEYNDWYTNRHVPDVLGVDGFVSGQRFRLDAPRPGLGELPPHRYLSLFEIEDGRLDEAQQALAASLEERSEAAAAGREPLMSVSTALAGPRAVYWATAITDQVRAGEQPAEA